MSERGKRINTNGPGPDKTASASEGKKFAAEFQKIIGDLQALYKNKEGVQDYGELLGSLDAQKRECQKRDHEVATLREELEGLRTRRDGDVQELQKQIASLEQQKDFLTDDFGKRYKAWNADARCLADERADLIRVRKERDATAAELTKAKTENNEVHVREKALAAELTKCQGDMAALRDRCEMKELELKQNSRSLEEYRRRYKEANDKLGILPLDATRLQQDLGEIATKLQMLVWNQFGKHDPERVMPVDVSGSTLLHVPQLASSSPAARAMRCALAEALVSRELYGFVFTDLYTLGGASGVPIEGTRMLLSWLEANSSLEATVTRCQLARALVNVGGAERCAQAAKRASTVLEPWLGADGRHAFTKSLGEIFGAAAALWFSLQRAQERVRAEGTLAHGDWDYEEDRSPDYDVLTAGLDTQGAGNASETSHNHNATSEFPLAVLFPHIYIDDHLVFHGRALFPSQQAVAVARLEQRNQASPRSNRTSLKRSNHLSQQESGQSSTGLRRSSVTSVADSRVRGPPSAAVNMSDLSSLRGHGSQVDSKAAGSEIGAAGSTKSQRSASGARRSDGKTLSSVDIHYYH